MKKVKLFEQFINEARVNAQDFADMFSETMANIEEQYDFEEELSTENLLYMLAIAWSEVAEQNNFNEKMSDLGVAFDRFNIDRSSKFMRADLTKEARYFGANAYGETGYHLQGMVECFCYILSDYGLVKPAIVKKIEKFLLNTSESRISEAKKITKSSIEELGDIQNAEGYSANQYYILADFAEEKFGDKPFPFRELEKLMKSREVKKELKGEDEIDMEYLEEFTESLIVNESAIDTLADEIDDAKVYDASSDGDSVDARSTKKTWDDGVPVLKYIARAPKKSVKLPKKFKVVDDTKYGWWYFQVGNTWYGIEQDDYGTPPFEY